MIDFAQPECEAKIILQLEFPHCCLCSFSRVLRSLNFHREHFLRGRVSGRRANGATLPIFIHWQDLVIGWRRLRTAQLARTTHEFPRKILSRWKTCGTISFFSIFICPFNVHVFLKYSSSIVAYITPLLHAVPCTFVFSFSFFYELRVRRR